MQVLRKSAFAAVAFAAVMLFSAKADAALLTITDATGPTTWTLDVSTGCTTCTVILSATFTDPDGAGSQVNGYTGDFLDSVQWVVGGQNLTGVSLTGTTAGLTTDWQFQMDSNLSGGNGCTGNANDNVCGEWISIGAGYGPIVNGSTLSWTFSATFASQLPSTLTTGNIRAAFNDANGKNVNTFSPGGGDFAGGGGGGTGGGGQTIPEPASMLLFGLGALGTGWRARRRAVR